MGLSDLFISAEDLPPGSYGFIQLLFLGAVYANLLMYASNLISDGSELLLLVPSLAGIVGSVVLPILGAVPDGCIVLFSGMGPNAQEQLNVGVGALAGSTIMLLTIPWFLSIVGGRVNIDPVTKMPNYKCPKLDPPDRFSLTGTGVALAATVNTGSVVMLVTSVTYLLLQVPGLVLYHATPAEQAEGEKNWAAAGTFLCVLLFGCYLGYQYHLSKKGLDTSLEIARQEYVHDAILAGKISLLGVMTEELGQYTTIGARSSTSYQSVPLSDYTGKSGKTLPSEALERLDRLLKPFFRAYDLDGTNTLSLSELTHVFRDLGERLSEKELAEVFADMDTDKSGEIDYKEFVNGTAHYILRQDLVQAHRMVRSKSMRTKSIDIEAAEHLKAIANTSTELEEEDDEEEEVPEDIKDLPPEEQQRRIKMRSLWMMAIGTAIVLVISDPMVEVLGEIGNRTGIPAFYISFVLAPLASNASELIAAYNYAQKKTVKTISISLATLQGAAVMNNTFVLGIFMLLIWTQGLVWEYFAETLAILVVQIIVAVFALKKVHTITDGIMILMLYPLSLLLVAGLESMGWN